MCAPLLAAGDFCGPGPNRGGKIQRSSRKSRINSDCGFAFSVLVFLFDCILTGFVSSRWNVWHLLSLIANRSTTSCGLSAACPVLKLTMQVTSKNKEWPKMKTCVPENRGTSSLPVLQDIEDREEEYPNDIDEVPI